jgi:hypothetical protein
MAEILLWLPVVSALAGGGLVGIINFTINCQNRKSEERRHLREIAFNTAFKYWKLHCDHALEQQKLQDRQSEVLPLDSYIINILKLSEVLLDKKINKNNIETKLKEIYEIEEVAEKVIRALQK